MVGEAVGTRKSASCGRASVCLADIVRPFFNTKETKEARRTRSRPPPLVVVAVLRALRGLGVFVGTAAGAPAQQRSSERIPPIPPTFTYVRTPSNLANPN